MRYFTFSGGGTSSSKSSVYCTLTVDLNSDNLFFNCLIATFSW